MLFILSFYFTVCYFRTISCQMIANGTSLFSHASFDYTLIPDHKIELNLENPQQRIVSPGFPNENYPPNIQVIYEVEMKLDDIVMQLSSRILISFEMFSLEDSEFCAKDGFEIADSSNKIQVYCGLQVGRTILSEGSKIYIRFFTNSKIGSRGYSIMLKMYSTGCSKHFQNINHGTFSSPNYPERYYSNDICVWKIDAPDDKRILLKFDDIFDIQAYEPLCAQDYLAVSLTGDFDTHIKRYCHGKRPVSMYSTGNSMLLMLHTDCCFEGKGFNATFDIIDDEEVVTPPPPKPLPQLCPCGIENVQESERIVGGKDVEPPNRYPWVVAIVRKLRNKTDDFFCGGALINRQYVLTAAHCLHKENIRLIRIVIGAHDLASEIIVVEAEEFIMHPKFQKRFLLNDIGLIKLRFPVDFNYLASPICLPTENDLTSSGDLAVVAGWGVQSFDNMSTALTTLQEIRVAIWSQAKCISRYGGIVLDTNICAGGKKDKDACRGDSGGPLFIKNNGKWYVVGIVSWGISCGREDYPGVYTRVSKYLPWIENQASDSPPCDEISPPVQPNFENCGLPNTGSTERIVGGTEASPFEFPWMAMIVSEKTVIGAGALISPYYVITSASLFDNTMKWYPELLSVNLGRHSLLKGKDKTSKRYSVKRLYLHPQFEKPSPYNNDIALLKLETPETGVSEIFKPICLPRSDAWYPPNLSLTTAGWGKTSNGGDGSNVLRKVDLHIWSEEQCEQKYPGWFTDTMLCAYKQGADTCNGDEGAPLMRLYFGRYYLAGLSSWASRDGCAVKDAPRVFSAVHSNLQWISSVTGINVE